MSSFHRRDDHSHGHGHRHRHGLDLGGLFMRRDRSGEIPPHEEQEEEEERSPNESYTINDFDIAGVPDHLNPYRQAARGRVRINLTPQDYSSGRPNLDESIWERNRQHYEPRWTAEERDRRRRENRQPQRRNAVAFPSSDGADRSMYSDFLMVNSYPADNAARHEDADRRRARRQREALDRISDRQITSRFNNGPNSPPPWIERDNSSHGRSHRDEYDPHIVHQRYYTNDNLVPSSSRRLRDRSPPRDRSHPLDRSPPRDRVLRRDHDSDHHHHHHHHHHRRHHRH